MLNVGDPNEAVTYFKNALAVNPDKIELKRGLAKSLSRAKLYTEATTVLNEHHRLARWQPTTTSWRWSMC